MASFKEALSKVVLNLFLLSVHGAPNLVTAINCFSPPLKIKIKYFWGLIIRAPAFSSFYVSQLFNIFDVTILLFCSFFYN